MTSASTQLRVKELLREKGWTTKILAEKTGMSESYLTHIKNGTRRWNEDSLRKLALAFEISPIELFAERRQRTDNIDKNVSMPEQSSVELKVQVVRDGKKKDFNVSLKNHNEYHTYAIPTAPKMDMNFDFELPDVNIRIPEIPTVDMKEIMKDNEELRRDMEELREDLKEMQKQLREQLRDQLKDLEPVEQEDQKDSGGEDIGWQDRVRISFV